MDQNAKKLKAEILRLYHELNKFYIETNETQQDSYNTGKKEAFEDVLNWLLSSHNNEYRYVNANAFFAMIQERITKAKGALNSISNDNTEDERGIKPLNLSNIRISESRKRVNKYACESINNVNYYDSSDCVMAPEEKIVASPFKWANQTYNNQVSQQESPNLFQNNNFAFGNDLGNSNNMNFGNNIVNNSNNANIFLPIKKDKKG